MKHYYFDPEVLPAVETAPALDLRDLVGARALMAERGSMLENYQTASDIDLEFFTRECGVDANHPPVPFFKLTRVDSQRQESGSDPAILIWFHGGGFVSGDAKSSVPFLEQAVRSSGVVAISVEYSLAPEQVYPTQISEGEMLLEWLLQNSAKLGFDDTQIVLGGQSAGAALALGLALKLRDAGAQRVVGLLLDTPVLDDRQDTLAMKEYDDTPVWNSINAREGWKAYLGGREADQYASPARAETFAGLPATFISVAQSDPLFEEGMQVAARMARDQVPIDLTLYAGTFHGSAGLAPAARVSQRQKADLFSALERVTSSR